MLWGVHKQLCVDPRGDINFPNHCKHFQACNLNQHLLLVHEISDCESWTDVDSVLNHRNTNLTQLKMSMLVCYYRAIKHHSSYVFELLVDILIDLIEVQCHRCL